MVDVFDQRLKQRYSQDPNSGMKNPYKDPFEERSNSTEFQERHGEGKFKSFARSALQIPQGIAEATPPGIAAGLWQIMGAEALDPEEIEHIRMVSEREGIPFDEEAYREAYNQASKYIPTVGNIGREIEERTGIPLEPKTGIQKALRLASTAGKFQPGTLGEKATAAVIAPATSALLQQTGLPEELSDMAGLVVGGGAGTKGPKIDIGKATKPSGMPVRRFEGLTETKKVSEGKINQINEKIKSDFNKISDKIIKESPVGETAENLKNDPTFKQESRELLNQAQVIADQIPGKISSKALKKEIADYTAKKVKGFSLNEYDKSYLKFMRNSIEDIVAENVTHGELVEQYRKNNASLGEYFEPGSSKALNRAKRDALLDNNRVIASVIEKTDPELANVFKEGNQRWTKIMDAEAVDGFVNEIFKEGVSYKKMNDFFDKNGYKFIFKRALGDEGYKAFEQLMKDSLQSESAYKMLKKAKSQGFMDLAKTGMAYILHPNLGYLKAGLEAAKLGYRSLVNAMLDKPKLTLTWKKAVEDLKKGDFKSAEKQFKSLRGEVEEISKPTESKESPETIEFTTEEVKPSEPKRLESSKKQIEFNEPAKPKEPIKTKEEVKPASKEEKTPTKEKPTEESVKKYTADEISRMPYEYDPKLGRHRFITEKIEPKIEKKEKPIKTKEEVKPAPKEEKTPTKEKSNLKERKEKAEQTELQRLNEILKNRHDRQFKLENNLLRNPESEKIKQALDEVNKSIDRIIKMKKSLREEGAKILGKEKYKDTELKPSEKLPIKTKEEVKPAPKEEKTPTKEKSNLKERKEKAEQTELQRLNEILKNRHDRQFKLENKLVRNPESEKIKQALDEVNKSINRIIKMKKSLREEGAKILGKEKYKDTELKPSEKLPKPKEETVPGSFGIPKSIKSQTILNMKAEIEEIIGLIKQMMEIQKDHPKNKDVKDRIKFYKDKLKSSKKRFDEVVMMKEDDFYTKPSTSPSTSKKKKIK